MESTSTEAMPGMRGGVGGSSGVTGLEEEAGGRLELEPALRPDFSWSHPTHPALVATLPPGAPLQFFLSPKAQGTRGSAPCLQSHGSYSGAVPWPVWSPVTWLWLPSPHTASCFTSPAHPSVFAAFSACPPPPGSAQVALFLPCPQTGSHPCHKPTTEVLSHHQQIGCLCLLLTVTPRYPRDAWHIAIKYFSNYHKPVMTLGKLSSPFKPA
jgi:hypothetical protein